MTVVRLIRGTNGEIHSCKAEGHSGYAAKGTDIVCSAVTVLLRTAMQVLSETPGVVLETDTSLRGNVYFSVKKEKPDTDTAARLICTGDFLEQGFSSLSKEYPANVELRKQTEA